MIEGHAFLFVGLLTLLMFYGAAALPPSALRRAIVPLLGILLLPMYPGWIGVTALMQWLAPNLPEHGWLANLTGAVKMVAGVVPYAVADWLIGRRTRDRSLSVVGH